MRNNIEWAYKYIQSIRMVCSIARRLLRCNRHNEIISMNRYKYLKIEKDSDSKYHKDEQMTATN